MTEAPIPPLVPAEVEPSLLDPCTCLRDGKPCRVCRLWDRHIAWFEARPEPNETVSTDA
jgi:hypothetical protein